MTAILAAGLLAVALGVRAKHGVLVSLGVGSLALAAALTIVDQARFDLATALLAGATLLVAELSFAALDAARARTLDRAIFGDQAAVALGLTALGIGAGVLVLSGSGRVTEGGLALLLGGGGALFGCFALVFALARRLRRSS